MPDRDFSSFCLLFEGREMLGARSAQRERDRHLESYFERDGSGEKGGREEMKEKEGGNGVAAVGRSFLPANRD